MITKLLKDGIRPRRGANALLALLVVWAAHGSALAQDERIPAITDDPVNRNWKAGSDGKLLTHDGAGAPELVMNKAALRQRGLTIEVEGTFKSLVLASGEQRFLIADNHGPHRVALNRSLVFLDGKPQSDKSSSWRTLLRDPNSERVSFSFREPGALKVKLRYDSDKAEVEPDKEEEEDEPSVGAAGDSPLAIGRINTMLIKARRGVFPILVDTENPTVYRRTYAFLVNDEGLAITQFHTLRNTAGAQALLPNIDEPVPVELWDAQPELDLALIKLPKEAVAQAKLNVLPVEKKGPTEGDSIWVLGVSREDRPTVTTGVIQTIKPHAQLSAELRRALPFEQLSHWVQTDAVIMAHSSGGPMINSEGKVVGMAVWVWPGVATSTTTTQTQSRDPRYRSRTTTSPAYMGLSGDHLWLMLAGRPDEPLTFERAKRMFYNTNAPHTRAPQLELIGDEPPTILQRAANTFATAATCPLCDGAGEVKLDPREVSKLLAAQQQQNENNNNNRNNRNDDQEETPQTKECARCKGNGFTRPEALLKLGYNVVSALTKTDPMHKDTHRTYVHLETKLVETLTNNPHRLAHPLNTEARKHLNRYNPSIGSPILFMGAVDEVDVLKDQAGAPLVMSLGDFEPRVFVTGSVVQARTLGSVVFVGGLLSGFVADDAGRLIPVIEGGFVVNVPEVDEEGRIVSGVATVSEKEKKNTSAQERYRQWMQQREAMMRAYRDRMGGRGGYGRR